MSSRYPIPAAPSRAELRFSNSRFIGSATHTDTVDAAKAYIAQIRAEMPDATHHVYAYLIGYGASVTAGMSDAGEPSGTAGRPALAVLRGSGLGDVTLVLTRYFGGTLLGTGGLVKAYGDTAKAVLEALPRTERIPTSTIMISIAYAAYTPVRQILSAHYAQLTDEQFATDVSLIAVLPTEHVAACVAAIETLTAGQAQIGGSDSG
ncbi:MAG: YigZ family protein [Chloroflexaceae bacterium]|nr:YigZ family protein [Chloroflexaceae bacterium]